MLGMLRLDVKQSAQRFFSSAGKSHVGMDCTDSFQRSNPATKAEYSVLDGQPQPRERLPNHKILSQTQAQKNIHFFHFIKFSKILETTKPRQATD
jgi:hypothetical protein